MSEFTLPVAGNLRSERISRVKSIYKELFSKEWKGKPVWEGVRDKELTAAPCFSGDQYRRENVRLMIVGRAVNGWEVDFENCSSCEAAVKSVLEQTNRMDDFAKDYTVDEAGKKYFYAKSSFLRMMKQMTAAFAGTDENWQRRIAWSNLFKIAPRNGGNPSWKMIRDDIPLYRELLEQEIMLCKPNVVVFTTDMNFFDPYPGSKKYESFLPLMKEEKPGIESKYICAAGSFAKDDSIKMIVCKRPERRPVSKLVQDIHEAYLQLTR